MGWRQGRPLLMLNLPACLAPSQEHHTDEDDELEEEPKPCYREVPNRRCRHAFLFPTFVGPEVFFHDHASPPGVDRVRFRREKQQ